MKRFCFILFVGIILLASCMQKSSKIDLESYLEYQKKGTEISQVAQSALLVNVGKAIQKGGPEYAVEFCNLQASSIVDGLNSVHNCVISRVSEKNRNPENRLKNEGEIELWNLFQNKLLADTLVQNKQKLVYYKPIRIGMPACLKCHGNPDSEISLGTMKKLQSLYPNDLAIGYKLNDFRGLWKIEFEKKP